MTFKISNELTFYSDNLGKWAKDVAIDLEKRNNSEEGLSPVCKFKRAVLKAALIGKNLRYPDTIPMQEKDWIEALDPSHRYGLILQKHFKLWKTINTSSSFQKWLYENGTECKTTKEKEFFFDLWNNSVDRNIKKFEDWMNDLSSPSQVIYLSKDQRKQYVACIDASGRISQNKKEIALSLHEKLIFVLSPDDEFYVGIYKKGVFNHSSFFSGAAVKAAGEFSISNGYIVEVVDKTGHYFDYHPLGSDFRMHLVLSQLKCKGADLSRAVVRLNVHPTSEFTPFLYNAMFYFKTRLFQQNWYKGKVSLANAKNLLEKETLPFLLRQYDYPVEYSKRLLIHNLLPIDPLNPVFEILWLSSDTTVKQEKIYLKGNSLITESGLIDKSMHPLIRKWRRSLSI